MKTNKKALWLMAIICLLSLSSCTNTIVKIFFKKDGSGTYSYIQDFSSMTTLMGDMVKDKIAAEMKEDNMVQTMQDAMADRISSIEGVSGVNTRYDEEAMHMILSFNFEDVTAIDKALEAMYGKAGVDTNKPFFKASAKRFERTSRQLFTAESMSELMGGGVEGMEEMQGMDDMMKNMNRDTFQELHIEFEREIVSFSNKEYKQLDDHTIRWRQFTFDEDDKDMDIAVKVKLK